MVNKKSAVKNILRPKKFVSETEMENFFAENLRYFFPNLIHIKNQWPIPEHNRNNKDNIVDALAAYQKRAKKTKPVLIEYKRKNDSDPITQILKYKRELESNHTNYYAIKDTALRLKVKIKWNDDSSAKDNLKNIILICIVDCYSFHKGGHGNDHLRTDADKDGVILVEARRYEDKENLFALISLVNREQKRRNEAQEILGVENKSFIVIIPKTKQLKKPPIDKKSKTSDNVQPSVRDKKENDTKNVESEKTSIDKFLDENNLDRWIREEIEIIDKFIRSLDKKEITGKATQPQPSGKHRCFTYDKKNQKSFLGIEPLKSEISIFLKKMKDQEVVDSIWKPNDKRGYYSGFAWKTIVKNKKDRQEILQSIKNYLNKIKERHKAK
ncbi:protein of unknown function [endosymbiont DhMRE of Dentiscutata heterogama]|uniref:hypothetical protein n=1 Tax=endosymbiont DhMRE of Dentiscutata heterogama TaxID=1609546 RepID=UPI000629D36F|nr:hypothetical protein [endosymbiont DhMRE of Dentiscutata heterogama]CFW93318.1 protein of unknown function [endosymbiont DhMRE of Dentiscutata heterogama]